MQKKCWGQAARRGMLIVTRNPGGLWRWRWHLDRSLSGDLGHGTDEILGSFEALDPPKKTGNGLC